MTERSEEEEREWQEALAHAQVLRRLPARPTAGQIADAIVELGVSRATFFRWLKRFREDERTTALVIRKAGRRPRIDAFSSALKAVVDDAIRTFYATPEKPTLTRLWRRIVAECRQRGMTPPAIRGCPTS